MSCCTVCRPFGVRVMVLRRPSRVSRVLRMRPLVLRRETTSAIVERSSEMRWPRLRWSRFGSLYRAFNAANCGDVIVCETSSCHSWFITCTARRSRWPGCCIRSSGECVSGGAFFTFHLYNPITDRQEAQPQALLDGAPYPLRQDQSKKGRGRAEPDKVPRATLCE